MKAKIVIFGIGRLFKKNIDKIDDTNQIVAIVDNSVTEEYVLPEGHIVSPVKKIQKLEFDYIIIFNKTFILDIYEQLVCEYGIPKEKIIGWQDYIYFRGREHKYHRYHSYHVINYLPQLWRLYDCKRICDYDLQLAKTGLKGKEYFIDCNLPPQLPGYGDILLTGFVISIGESWPGYINLYDSYCNWDNVQDKEFDMILLLDLFLNKSLKQVIDLLQDIMKVTRYALVTIPYVSPNGYEGWTLESFSCLGEVEEFSAENERYILIKRNVTSNCSNDSRLYVVTHKKYFPIYDANECNMRIPIQAGACMHEGLGYEKDDSGVNISELNPYINECTALYWIWKNVKCRYIGIEHYRRAFLARANIYDETHILREDDVEYYLEKYDFLVARAWNIYPKTVIEEIQSSIVEEAFLRYSIAVRLQIEQVAPDYVEAYDTCLNGFSYYPCNLFITEWDKFDAYCEWLFSILLGVIDKEDLERYDDYSKRVVGFFAERLLTVWLLKHNYRVKELFFVLKE